MEEHGTRQLHLPGMLRGFAKPVSPVPQLARQRHHQPLTDGIDRRIRHLRKLLPEIGREKFREFRKDCDRSIVPHGTDGFFPLFDHGLQQRRNLLGTVAEAELLAY